MKTSTLITLFTVTIASPVAVMAKSCVKGGVYCGSSLLRRGNYKAHIVETLEDAGVGTDDWHVQNALFDCLKDGDIRYRAFCDIGCGGTDSTDADYCF
ncbi:hypothetical protein K458DRAFT_394975 [Lentithecium fluviatile CBS 122367]|uniref:Killer toxin Kp4 domain-containing protein n=1 Tax=Lentithecium fluviatile CBS 122367 TaxID=1168545 RepID=A0A6G1IJW0_9PLEO|nr:hypothetical protein K458DRAFT_394975 [Lentithecium fluviatile CBS 122367]